MERGEIVSIESTWLSLLTVCVVWIATAHGLAPVSSQAHVNEHCNFTQYYISSSLTLQQAVTSISNDHSRGSKCIRIVAHSGNHTLTSQILFPAEVGEIEIVGLESVNISCAYDPREDYTWYFDHLSSVMMKGINFVNCPRPLRLDTISNVTIQNCSFR